MNTELITTPEQCVDIPEIPMSWTRCVAVPGDGCIIDLIHPITGKTLHRQLTVEQIQEETPAAVLMAVADHCQAKAARQDSAVTWDEITEDQYWYWLECLPPALMLGGSFLVGEPWDHHALTGQPRFQGVLSESGRYYASSRPMTRAEFRSALALKFAGVKEEAR